MQLWFIQITILFFDSDSEIENFMDDTDISGSEKKNTADRTKVAYVTGKDKATIDFDYIFVHNIVQTLEIITCHA